MVVLQTKNPIIILLLLCILPTGCGRNKLSLETVAINTKITPAVHTDNFSGLISDSGITRYRLNGKACDVFIDGVPEPYWFFSEGFYLEKFDSVFNVEGSVTSDTAYYYNETLWQLVGNVKVVNLLGEKFETSELFWSEKNNTAYTDKFIKIERRGQTHFGYGLRSNGDMSNWVILNHSGDIDVQENVADSSQVNQKTDPQTEPVKQ